MQTSVYMSLCVSVCVFVCVDSLGMSTIHGFVWISVVCDFMCFCVFICVCVCVCVCILKSVVCESV